MLLTAGTLALMVAITQGLERGWGSRGVVATVAITTTASIFGEAVAKGGYSQPQIALLVIAVSAGSIILSHVNDGGFWIVSKYFNMTVKQTLMTWTVLETILSIVGFAMVLILWAFV